MAPLNTMAARDKKRAGSPDCPPGRPSGSAAKRDLDRNCITARSEELEPLDEESLERVMRECPL
jgi:hypothetical protein